MGRYMLTIDSGLTKGKVVITDLQGHEISDYVGSSCVENVNNNAEISMHRQWENTTIAIRAAMDKANINNSEIACVAITAHGAGLYMIDEKGEPIRNAFSSIDGRGVDIISKWEAENRSVFDLTYQHMWNGQPIPYLYWLKMNEPDSYAKIHKILLAKDWIKFKLTGNLNTDYSDAINSGLVNVFTQEYDIDILKPFGLEDMYDKLPEIYDSTEIIGTVTNDAAQKTGLRVGTPVVNGVLDVVACAAGNGIYDDSQYSIISGTWGINSALVNQIKPNKYVMTWTSFVDKNQCIVFDASPTGAVNFEWYINNIIKTFGSESMSQSKIYETVENRLRRSVRPNPDLIYMPFIHQSRLSKKMQGTFFGIDASHNTYDLIAAIYEGVVFAHSKHLQNLKDDGIIRKKAMLSGGVTNSDFWSQLFADILNMEVTTTATSQAGALGSAICAGIATGAFDNVEQGVQAMVREKKTFYPRKEYVDLYEPKYEKFSRLIEIVDENL